MTKPILEEIKDAIEYRQDEWPIHMILKYAPDHVVVIWADDELSRDTFTMEWAEVGGEQQPWNGVSYEPEYSATTDVECVHVNGEPCEQSLENEIQRLVDIAELW